MRSSLSACLPLSVFLLFGALWGLVYSRTLAGPTVRMIEQNEYRQRFELNRSPEDRLEVTESRWLFLPFVFGDFDLQMDVELGEGVDLDVLLRRAEPRTVDGVRQQFAGRFTTLRLSAIGERPRELAPAAGTRGWLSRDVAVQHPRGGGVELGPGHLATVWISARGRTLTANVAGTVLPPFEAEDVYGMLTMTVKGGSAIVHRLEIEPCAAADRWLWSWWVWLLFGALAAASVAGVTVLVARRVPGLGNGPIVLLMVWLLVRRVDTEWCVPEPLPALLGFAGFAAVSWTLTVGERRWWLRALAMLLPVALIAYAMPRLEPEHATVDAIFGEYAGRDIAEAHGQLARGPAGLDDVAHDGPRVFLLGGEPVYNRGEPGDHIAVRLETSLRANLQDSVQVVTTPTIDAWAEQQWRMFDLCYQGFEPDVVVLGVGGFEDVVDVDGAPRSSPQALAALVREIAADCRERGRRLVVFAAPEAPQRWRERLAALAVDDVNVVLARTTDDVEAIVSSLTEAISPLLR